MGNVCVLTGYGINADQELAEAFRMVGGEVECAHVKTLVETPSHLDRFGVLAIPGGFSFGDHIGSGMVFAGILRDRLGPAIRAFVLDGGLVIGICNGFQILVKSGLLPDLEGTLSPVASLVWNEQGHFVDRWVSVEVSPEHFSPWLADIPGEMDLPIRHGEGRFVFADANARAAVLDYGGVVMRYRNGNPNGSEDNIAGICDPTGRIIGMMPHPEAYLRTELHPNATGTGRSGAETHAGSPALAFFRNGVRAARVR